MSDKATADRPGCMTAESKKRSWGFDRKEKVTVRFSEEEKHRIQARADAAGRRLSTFIREASLHGPVASAVVQPGVFQQRLRHQLRQIHTGLQQARIHAGKEAGAEHLRRAMTLLNETIQEI